MDQGISSLWQCKYKYSLKSKTILDTSALYKLWIDLFDMMNIPLREQTELRGLNNGTALDSSALTAYI